MGVLLRALRACGPSGGLSATARAARCGARGRTRTRVVISGSADADRWSRDVAAAAALPAAARVLVVGAAAAAPLVPALQAAGAQQVLVADASQAALDKALSSFPSPGTLGNAPGVRGWCGDAAALPPYEGPFAAALLAAAAVGAAADGADLVSRVALLLAPGGHVVVFQEPGAAAAADLGPPATLAQRLSDGSPLQPEAVAPSAATAVLTRLQLPPAFAMPGAPVRLGGRVVSGFGRGSAKMGVPTANLPPEELGPALGALRRGVYFGWAALRGDAGGPRKMVMNVGQRPTFADGTGDTVEVHVMHDFGRQFYGEELRVVVTGHVRREMRFANIGDLVTRILTDVGVARNMLDAPPHAAAAADPYLTFAP